jgi:hypothetical protein
MTLSRWPLWRVLLVGAAWVVAVPCLVFVLALVAEGGAERRGVGVSVGVGDLRLWAVLLGPPALLLLWWWRARA